MKYDQLNIKAWNKQLEKNQMLYPDERVIACLAKYFNKTEENKSKKALDIGFGSGRHIKLLLDYGFDAYGIDYSESSVKIANTILKNFQDRIHLTKADLRDDLFPGEYFDFIICYGVIFLREKREMIIDLEKVYSLLNKTGKMIVNFRTKDDYNYRMGKEVDNNTFLLDERAGGYANMLYTFLSLEEASKMLTDTGFIILNRERIDFWKNNLEQHHSWWIFTVGK